MMKSNTNKMGMMELNMANLPYVTGGTPKSIPGGKRSGRKNSETAAEIAERVGDWCSDILESLGLKQKPVNNSIYDRRLPEDWINQ